LRRQVIAGFVRAWQKAAKGGLNHSVDRDTSICTKILAIPFDPTLAV
jgi:hypothetical protein